VDWEHSQEGLKQKGSALGYRDWGFEEASVGDIGDWKTPKPNCYFLLRTEKHSSLRVVMSRTDLWVKY
jgi:hypothetical protein